jgi:hypothetical protein
MPPRYLRDFNVDLKQAAVRSTAGKLKEKRAMMGGWWLFSNPKQHTIERIILTLARRSLRKAGYLKRLKAF